MTDTNIGYLLKYCADMPELYNKVATKLWIEFGIQSAEVCLLCTFMVNEFYKRKGNWRDAPKYKNIAWKCSECGYFTTMKHNYCPTCGAKMVKPQESENKEKEKYEY